MKKICLLLTFVFVMLLGVSALADMDVKELTVQFVPTNTETADATTAEFSAYMTELMGIPVKMTVATSYNAIVEARWTWALCRRRPMRRRARWAWRRPSSPRRSTITTRTSS